MGETNKGQVLALSSKSSFNNISLGAFIQITQIQPPALNAILGVKHRQIKLNSHLRRKHFPIKSASSTPH
jgi:hypothetical protein